MKNLNMKNFSLWILLLFPVYSLANPHSPHPIEDPLTLFKDPVISRNWTEEDYEQNRHNQQMAISNAGALFVIDQGFVFKKSADTHQEWVYSGVSDVHAILLYKDILIGRHSTGHVLLYDEDEFSWWPIFGKALKVLVAEPDLLILTKRGLWVHKGDPEETGLSFQVTPRIQVPWVSQSKYPVFGKALNFARKIKPGAPVIHNLHLNITPLIGGKVLTFQQVDGVGNIKDLTLDPNNNVLLILKEGDSIPWKDMSQ